MDTTSMKQLRIVYRFPEEAGPARTYFAVGENLRWITEDNGNLRVYDNQEILAEFQAGIWLTAILENYPTQTMTTGTNASFIINQNS